MKTFKFLLPLTTTALCLTLLISNPRAQNLPPTSITYTLQGTRLTFANGTSGGAMKGGFVSVNGAGRTFGPFRIISATAQESTVFVPTNSKIPTSGTIELLTPNYGTDPLVIGIEQTISADDPIALHLKGKYRPNNSQFVRLAVGDEIPNLVLMRGSRRLAFGEEMSVGDSPTQEGYYLLPLSGRHPLFGRFFPLDVHNTLSASDEIELFDTVEDYAAQRDVKSPYNASHQKINASEAVTVSMYRINGSYDEQHRWHHDAADLGLRPIDWRQGQISLGYGFYFNFKNQTINPLYVALLWVSEDGTIIALQDKSGQKQILLQPKGHDGSAVHTDNYGVSPPFGSETLKFIVSRKPINVELLERSDVKGKQSHDIVSIFDHRVGLGAQNIQPPSDSPEFDSWDIETGKISIAE